MLNILFPLLDAAPAAAPSGMGGGSSMLIMILLMILVFYFFMIRPQQKKQKKIEEARNSLQKGDKVVTIGGIHGKITDIKDNTFTIEIAHDVRIEVDKAAISFNEANLNQSKTDVKPEEKKENE
ncbi:MAG: preprotein translocase subunit YajC [Bacteroidales bacterium]|nr:preprotein translocase subunit YajC [Bacteroidales bacterium]MDD6185624.1 preprotein translocase subunit YajC [Bacteroidales bacterium]